MNQMSSCHTKLRHALIHKLGLAYGPGIEDCEISEAVGELINERNALRESHSMIAATLQISSAEPSDILNAVDTMRKERDEFTLRLSEITKMLVEADLMRRNVNSSVESLIEIANAPDTAQPQLSEIRYVLHGDIQPCSVLYSDDTTTLLRLDEGDVMCETDTIEWSDSVTYRCQELLKSAAVKLSVPVTLSPIKLFAQLVRDERILLNDDSELGADEAYFRDEGTHTVCVQCERVFEVALDLCPHCHTRKGPLPLSAEAQIAVGTVAQER